MSIQTLRQRAAEASTPGAPIWDPQEGETLAGTVSEVRTVDTRHGPTVLLTVTPISEDGEIGDPVALWCGRKHLARQIADLAPRPGDEIAIKYHGLQEPAKAGGQAWNGYTVLLQRDGADVLPASGHDEDPDPFDQE